MSKAYVYLNGDENISKYFRDLRKNKILTPDEEVELAIRIQNGDEEAKEKLIISNLKFVVSIAKEYQGQGLSLSDLINEGNLGLIKAATRFDYTKGFRFISYAVWWIRQTIIQSLIDNSRMIRLPANIVNKINDMKKNIERFELENERAPVFSDFIDNDNALDIFSLPKCGSYNEVINEDGDELYTILEDTSYDERDGYYDIDERVKLELENVLSSLSDREREIIECYYGINKDFDGMTLEAIGDKYGLTKERIRQIKSKALRKIRHNSHDLFNALND